MLKFTFFFKITNYLNITKYVFFQDLVYVYILFTDNKVRFQAQFPEV